MMVDDDAPETGTDDAAALGDLDSHSGEAHAPEHAVSASLRQAMHAMREEADRIAALETGDEQVEAAERFAEGAGSFDAELGAAARGNDAEGRD